MDETLPRKKKIKKYINNDLQISSDDSEKNKKILMKEYLII